MSQILTATIDDRVQEISVVENLETGSNDTSDEETDRPLDVVVRDLMGSEIDSMEMLADAFNNDVEKIIATVDISNNSTPAEEICCMKDVHAIFPNGFSEEYHQLVGAWSWKDDEVSEIPENQLSEFDEEMLEYNIAQGWPVVYTDVSCINNGTKERGRP